MSTPSMNSTPNLVPTAEMIHLISVEGRSLFVSQLLEKDAAAVRKIFQQIMRYYPNSVGLLNQSHYRISVTRQNTTEHEYRTVQNAVGTILATSHASRERRKTLAGRVQSWKPAVMEGLSMVSDATSTARNGMAVANKVNAVAKAWLGTIGGAANVAIGAGIVHGAVQQYNAAAIAKDQEGQFEAAYLTAPMGIALVVLGVAMVLLFPHLIAAAAGTQFLFTSAFILYAIMSLRCAFIVDYLTDFRSGLTKILEDRKLNDEEKTKRALEYLNNYTKTSSLRSKLDRRVGPQCASDLDMRLPALLQRVENGDLLEAQELIHQVLEANRDLLVKQFLFFVISVIGVLSCTAGLGVAPLLSGAVVDKLFLANAVLWFVNDSSILSSAWSTLTRKLHPALKPWRGTLLNREFKKELQQYIAAKNKVALLQNAMNAITTSITRGYCQITIDGKPQNSGTDVAKYLQNKISVRDIFIMMSHLDGGIYFDVTAGSPDLLGYNKQPKLPVGHRLGNRVLHPKQKRHVFEVKTGAGKTAVLTHEVEVQVTSGENPIINDNSDFPVTVHATKRVRFTLHVPSAELTLTVL